MRACLNNAYSLKGNGISKVLHKKEMKFHSESTARVGLYDERTKHKLIIWNVKSAKSYEKL